MGAQRSGLQPGYLQQLAFLQAKDRRASVKAFTISLQPSEMEATAETR